MCNCKLLEDCNGSCRALCDDKYFDKAALQESVNLMSAAISRVGSLEFALKNAISVIETMKGAIGKDCYRYSNGSSQVSWHVFAAEEQAKLKKVLDQMK